MAIKCNPPNIPCGGRCIPPGSVCGGKDKPLSPENNERLNKLSNAIGLAKPKPPAPKQKDLETRSLELERRKFELEKETANKADNDITLKQRLLKKSLDKEQKSINLEKKEKSLKAKENALKKINEPKEEPEEKPTEEPTEEPFDLNGLLDSIQEGIGATTDFLDTIAEPIGLDVIPSLTNPAKDTLSFIIDRLKKKDN